MKKLYISTTISVWLGTIIGIGFGRYITISPMPWSMTIRLGLLMGAVCTPVMLFLVWLGSRR